MRLLVTGDRDWACKDTIRRVLTEMLPLECVIHGCCRGADILAGEVAQELGVTVYEFPAKWEELGRKAGVVRNQQMIDEGFPDLILAFHLFIWRSRGTKDMLARAEREKIPTKLVDKYDIQ